MKSLTAILFAAFLAQAANGASAKGSGLPMQDEHCQVFMTAADWDAGGWFTTIVKVRKSYLESHHNVRYVGFNFDIDEHRRYGGGVLH